MAGHRFYLPKKNWKDKVLTLDPEESHHCVNVLRLEPGARVAVFDGVGGEAHCVVKKADKKAVELEVLQKIQTPAPRCAITLGQAIPKGKNMELIVQKAVELGAAHIVPLISERTVIDLDGKDAAKKREKWQQIAIEACKQCGQNWLPEVSAPQSLESFFKQGKSWELMLVASLQPEAKQLKSVLAEFQEQHGKRPASACIFIGPEGDFTPAEISRARSEGCHPITLGPIVLRTETAALYCLSVLSHELFSEEK
ncbi:MAG: 16S rRNA (uracil(1498)-N(3))-methyltransferase [Chthoniobacterales bacterium]